MSRLICFYLASFLVAGCAASDRLPEHPSQLQFGERELVFLNRADYRHELPTGDVLFVVPDPAFPLIKVSIFSPAGSYLMTDLPPGTAGLASAMLRDGGTRHMSPEELDERLDFLATSISFSISGTGAGANLNTLSANYEESLRLMFDMLTEPALDAERMAINIERQVESMRRRNDDTRAIEPRVWSELMLGEDFFATRLPTEASLRAIEEADLRSAIGTAFARGRLVIAVSGDITVEAATSSLTEALQRLPQGAELPPVPDDLNPVAPGVYTVNKDDVNQTRVSLGLPGPRVHHPDQYAISLMNHILGGGGFTSRITSRVRSDEGLAYSAGSRFTLGRHYDGQFRASFQSKNESVPQALSIVLEEIERIREQPVTEEELAVAREARVAFLADLYASADASAQRFARDELFDEPADYWRNYESSIRAVSVADIQRVAQTHLDPAALRILLVGKIDEALSGDGSHGTLMDVTGAEPIAVPLKDPLTLEPLVPGLGANP